MAGGGRDREFLFEMGMLRYVPRSWRQFLNKDFANVTEHTFRVMWIALVLAKREGADIDKVMRMALVHDLTESRTPDVHHVSRMYAKRHDDAAIKDILARTSLEQEFLAAFHEYEERSSLEARIVKDADTLDVDFELEEQYANGVRLKETFQEMRAVVAGKLFTKSAKELWDGIQGADPHEWHLKGPNRLNSGDWKR